MKLHHLRLRGIGPFREEVDVDLAALGASGMFLLEGPTGSGKSTLLDAIVYALYGSVAGEGSDTGRIRSQFSPPTEASVVDLVFETSSGVYRVRREPPYDRAKQRGTGTTPQNAKALLWKLGSPDLIPAVLADRAGTGAGVTAMATRLDEVGREIQEALGLTRAQFTQTVLLPQNEFARFLRADTAERQTVLQRVFGTELYERIERELEERRRRAKAEVEKARGTLGSAVARLAEAAGIEDEQRTELESLAQQLQLDELAEAAAGIATAVGAAAQQAITASETAAKTAATARTRDEEARARRQLLRRRAELDALSARLATERDQVDAAAKRLTSDTAARPVVAVLRRREAAAERVTRARATLTDLLADETTPADVRELVGSTDPSGTAELDALATLADTARERAGTLSALVDLEAGLDRRGRELADRTSRREALTKDLATRTAALAARPAAREELTTALQAARAGAAQLADAVSARAQAKEQRDAAREAARLAAAVAEAEKTASAATTAAKTAIADEAALRRRRLDGIAAELALDLAPGEPCAVCGSTDHPQPAQTGADPVGEEDLAAAEKARQDAEARAAEATAALTLATGRQKDAVRRAGERDVETAQLAATEAEAAVTTARGHQERAAELETALADHDTEDRRLREVLHQDSARVEKLDAQLATEREQLEKDTAAVRDARGEDASVTARRDAHLARARAASSVREARIAADQATAQHGEIAAEVTTALEGTFADEASARAAVLAAEDRRALEKTVEDRRIDEARLADGLAEPGIAEIEATEEATAAAQSAVTAAAEAVTTAETAAKTAHSEAGRASAAATRTTTARSHLATAISQVTCVRDRAGSIVRLANLAAGTGGEGERIRLSTFVLMQRFEKVVDAANARLARFGSALELERVSSAGRGKRSGLDLHVIDRRTDASRVPATLSGGETFFVSLALALGLADIVTAEAGGIQIDTLFIDEGFGSLDPEMLDTVIGEIGRLAERGRTIGVVSHVGEMKSRISEQIHVRRGPDGCSRVSVTA